MTRTLTTGLIFALGLITAGPLAAQQAGSRSATLRVGGLMYDRGNDATNLMLGAGVDWALSRHVLAEVEGSWSAAPDVIYDYSNPQAPRELKTTTHLATLTTGIQAQAQLGRVRPYAGMAAGLFVHYDTNGVGDRYPRYTVGFPAGIRVDITDRLGVRGELRARFDTHQDGGSGVNVEQSLGLTFRF